MEKSQTPFFVAARGSVQAREIVLDVFGGASSQIPGAINIDLGGRSAAAGESEKDRRIGQLERTLGRKSLEIEILKNAVGE